MAGLRERSVLYPTSKYSCTVGHNLDLELQWAPSKRTPSKSAWVEGSFRLGVEKRELAKGLQYASRGGVVCGSIPSL